MTPGGSMDEADVGVATALFDEFDWDELGRSGPPGAPGAGVPPECGAAWGFEGKAFIRSGETDVDACKLVAGEETPAVDLDSPVSTRFRGLCPPEPEPPTPAPSSG